MAIPTLVSMVSPDCPSDCSIGVAVSASDADVNSGTISGGGRAIRESLWVDISLVSLNDERIGLH